MEHTIYDAAVWFLKKEGGAIGSKKMQKLCYYAQAWSYAIRDKELFDGAFEAWVHGPVNAEMWYAFKDISYREIVEEDFSNRGIKTEGFTSEEESFLDRVWETYGRFYGSQLEDLTHEEKPWMEQRKGLSPDERCHRIISAETMRDFYRSLYVDEEDT